MDMSSLTAFFGEVLYDSALALTLYRVHQTWMFCIQLCEQTRTGHSEYLKCFVYSY